MSEPWEDDGEAMLEQCRHEPDYVDPGRCAVCGEQWPCNVAADGEE